MPSLDDLPKELQNQIWREALVYDKPLRRKEALGNGTTSQLFVSKRIRQEYAPIFWRENIFVMDLEPPGQFMQEHWHPKFYTRSRMEVMLGLPRQYTKHIRNVTVREPFQVVSGPIIKHLHTWIGKIMPNIVYMNIHIIYSTSGVGWSAWFKDFWRIIQKTIAPKYKHIRLMRLGVMNLGCLGPEFDALRENPLRNLMDGSPMPMPFNSELSFGGSGFHRGAVGGWVCTARDKCTSQIDHHPSMVQCLFEMDPCPGETAFSRAIGGPFAAAKLADFFAETPKSTTPDDKVIEGKILKLHPPNDLTSTEDFPSYKDFVEFIFPWAFQTDEEFDIDEELMIDEALESDEELENDEEMVIDPDELAMDNEDLVETIDELLETNAELVKKNEELVKSNEELVKTNAELTKTNEELVKKNGELVKSNGGP